MQNRLEVRQRSEDDPNFRLEVLRLCKEDTLYWFDNFAFTFDPRIDPSEVPFIPYDGKQVRFIEYMEGVLKNPKDVFIDKPRDVGATSLMMNFILKHWLFDEFFNARVGSRKEEYVDRAGDPDTLYFKLDYTLNRLPKWMLPDDWNDKIHRTYMRLIRPDSSNSIVGESANPNFARGGRQTIVFFDEIGFWPFARSAWESAGDVTNIRIAMTTPPDSGKSSHAYKLYSGQAGEIDKFGFEYSDVPTKTPEWVALQRKRRSTEEFEREVMKSYSGTTEGKVYAAEWRLHVEENKVDYNPNLPLFISWDFGLDEVAMLWLQKDLKTNKVRVIDCYNNSDKPIDYYIPLVTGDVPSGLFEYDDSFLDIINRHKDWKRDVTHYGDPDVVSRNLTDKKSPFAVLREAGIYINSKPWGGRKHRDIREKAKLLLRRLEVNYERCEYFIECMVSAKYPVRQETSQAVTPADKPVHDWTSHYRSAFEYFADNEPLIKEDVQVDQSDVGYKYRPMGGYR